MLSKTLQVFERFTVTALIIMMILVILFSTIELAVFLINQIFTPPLFLLGIGQLLDIFGFFFMILIGLELLETIRMYITRSHIHVEIVFLVAMIAVARKVIILDITSINPVVLIGIASIILALTSGYFLVKQTHSKG